MDLTTIVSFNDAGIFQRECRRGSGWRVANIQDANLHLSCQPRDKDGQRPLVPGAALPSGLEELKPLMDVLAGHKVAPPPYG